MDIIVTTPKSDSGMVASEAAAALSAGGGSYFRRLSPKTIKIKAEIGDKLFYVENGFIRGFAIITEITTISGLVCTTTGRDWGPGTFIVVAAASWCWVRPVPFHGFQGWRYFRGGESIEIIGDWRSPPPMV